MLHALSSPLTRFVLQAIAVMVAARSIGLLARRMNQPLVIAEVIAGIVLGPSLLGWLAPSISAALFPPSSLGLLGIVSQIGLVLFMFLVGLELDPSLLRNRVRASVAISQSSIIVPFALGAAAATRLHHSLAPAGVPLLSFILFLGIAMSITAFPVLARILVERRLLRSRVGAITIACAAVDDITAWCGLAFVVSVVRANNVVSAVVTTALALAYVGVMLLVVRPLLVRVSDRTKLGLSQNLVAVILVGLLASSTITEMIGIHALFGAFLFGAVIPKQGSFASALAEKLEDVVVVFLLPLFFAYSGLRTQVGLLSSAESWITCAALTALACLGKFGGGAVAARLTGIPWREASAIGVLMNTRGLMELVVLNIGLDLGVISPMLFTMMVIMALATTFMTTPLLEWIYPMERFARELAENIAEPSTPSLTKERFTALVCVAYERSGPALIRLAAVLAGREEESRIYALRLRRATDRASFYLDEKEAPDVSEDRGLAPLLQRAREESIAVRPLSFVTSAPARDICDVAEVKHADIVLLGWHKPLFAGTMLSGTVHDVMESASSTVGVFVDRGLDRVKRVLVPHLGREHDAAALAVAKRIAKATDARVTVLHVLPSDGAAPASIGDIGQCVEVVATRAASPVDAATRESANGYDLVVIGIGEAWGLEHRSFGLRTEAILRSCPTSVLVVRGPEREPAESRARLSAPSEASAAS